MPTARSPPTGPSDSTSPPPAKVSTYLHKFALATARVRWEYPRQINLRLPYLDQITFKSVGSDEAAYESMLAGEGQVYEGLGTTAILKEAEQRFQVFDQLGTRRPRADKRAAGGRGRADHPVGGCLLQPVGYVTARTVTPRPGAGRGTPR